MPRKWLEGKVSPDPKAGSGGAFPRQGSHPGGGARLRTRGRQRLLAAAFLLGLALARPPSAYVERMGVGVDANWATFKWEVEVFDEQIPRDFKAMGFTHVRIRAKGVGAPGSAELGYLERVVRASLKAGLLPVLAYSGGALNQDPSERALKDAVAWWKGVSERFAGYPEALAFDLYIEPAKAINAHPERLLAYYRKALAAIRPRHPRRVVFLAPRFTAKPAYLPELLPLFRADPYTAAESHFFASGPSKTRENKRWTTGTPEEKARVLAYVEALAAFRERTGVPVWQGAWMPGNYNKGNDYSVPEQVKFATFLACALKRARIPYAVNADHKFYDPRKKAWIPEMLPVVRAVVRPRCPATGAGR